MNKKEILFKECKGIAIRYFYTYKYKFLKNGLDLDDVIQESYFVINDTYNKYPEKEFIELKKITNQAISWKYRNMVKKYNKMPEIFPFEETLHISSKNPNKEIKLLFEQIKKISTKRDYDILKMRFLEKKTYEEISKEMELSKMGVKYILEKIIDKIKVKINDTAGSP